MASINYEKEWVRIATRLEWTLARLQRQLARAQLDDERAPILAKMGSVQIQIDHARDVAGTYAAKRQKST
jgi:hypothetical protein